MHNFLLTSAACYETENARQDVVTPFLRALLGRSLMDGIIPCLPARTDVPIPLLILELKNEMGTGGVDVTTQAGSSYRESWSQNEVHHLWFPFIIKSLTSSSAREPRQLLPYISTGSHGTVAMRSWRGFHRQACCSAADPIFMVGWLACR